VLTASIVRAMPYLIALMMEASISMSLNVYETTGRNTPEDNHLHTRSRESLKSYQLYLQFLLFTKYQ
jgi:hypothetical protein